MAAAVYRASTEIQADLPMIVVAADWLLPILRQPVRDGALAVQDGSIIDLGVCSELQEKYGVDHVVRRPGLLMPGLVNCHAHLELSAFDPHPVADGEGFVDWVRALLRRRAENFLSKDEVIKAADRELQHQKELGVICIADIGNELFPEFLDNQNDSWPQVYRMLEMLAPNDMASQTVREKLKNLDTDIPVTGHAPYSTVPEILQFIKKRCANYGHIFSIHTAESPSESEFIRSNAGPFRDFLEERNSWDGAFSETGAREEGTVEYYQRLGLLDEKTLLVHCVHVSDHELNLVASAGANICLCPGSNRFLGVGIAPVVEMVTRGILPALGTDSLASNPVLNMWREMQILAEEHPSLPHEMILSMATLGGAKALGLDAQLGSLEIGRKATFLSIQDVLIRDAENSEALFCRLVTGGGPDEIEWLSFN